MKKKLIAVLAVGVIVSCANGVANAFFIDFEGGVDQAPVDDITGVTFETFNGYDALYLYGPYYNVNDHDLAYNNGPYQIYGYYGIWAGINADAYGVKIDFTNNDGTWFSTGYSSYSDFYVDAYLTDGTMVTASGASNYGGNMSFLSVYATSGTNIDYVVIHDTGNYWVADNMSGDTSGVDPVPEPATMLLFGTGLAGLAAVGRRRGRK